MELLGWEVFWTQAKIQESVDVPGRPVQLLNAYSKSTQLHRALCIFLVWFTTWYCFTRSQKTDFHGRRNHKISTRASWDAGRCGERTILCIFTCLLQQVLAFIIKYSWQDYVLDQHLHREICTDIVPNPSNCLFQRQSCIEKAHEATRNVMAWKNQSSVL